MKNIPLILIALILGGFMIVLFSWLGSALPTKEEKQKAESPSYPYQNLEKKIEDCRSKYGDVAMCDGTGGARMGL